MIAATHPNLGDDVKRWAVFVFVPLALVASGCASTSSSETPPAAEATPTETSTETSPAPEYEPAGEEEDTEEAPATENQEEGAACGGEVEGPGSECHAEDEKFCSEHSCIPNFPNGNGAVVECVDGEYSHSGGLSGACSDHGGENE